MSDCRKWDAGQSGKRKGKVMDGKAEEQKHELLRRCQSINQSIKSIVFVKRRLNKVLRGASYG